MPKRDDPYVLVVDDEESARDLAERFLNAAGYRTTAVGNRAAALEVLMRHHVDVVVADWNLRSGLPGGTNKSADGLELLVTAGERRPGIGRLLWCSDPLGCRLAAERGIRCVEKSGRWAHLAVAVEAELPTRPLGVVR